MNIGQMEMTMTFAVKEPSLLSKVKVEDKVNDVPKN
jgi:Cu/Ag efflux protein CusF